MSWLSQVWNVGPGWLLSRFTLLGWFVGTGKPLINWTPSPQFGYQAAHFFCAASFVLAMDKVVGCPWWLTAALGTGLAFFKEFFVDIKIIEGDSYLSSAWDFTWYMIGILLSTHLIRHPL